MTVTIVLALPSQPLTSPYELSELGATEPCHYAFERNQGSLNLVVFSIEVTL
jgi:hypothetical protein